MTASVSSPAAPAAGPLRWLFGNPYLLLILTMAMWGGHSVVSRLAVGEISPATLTCLRWSVVCGVMVPLSARGLRQHWPVLRPRLGYLAVMGALGYTSYNILLYWSAHTTTAINISIINAAMPALIFAGAFVAYRQPVLPLQWLGLLVSMGGVLVTAAKGEPANLLALSVNQGDVLILIATVLYAGYSVLLRRRPPVPAPVFFTAMALAAAAASFVVLGVEIAAGDFFIPTWKGWAALVFVAIFPSLLSQIFFMRAVELIGPGRAGLFTNLMPLFGAGFAMLVLGEVLAPYHIVALALVIGGILLAELRRR
jgi:drug/metabolite transporter (DMT)-like permease